MARKKLSKKDYLKRQNAKKVALEKDKLHKSKIGCSLALKKERQEKTYQKLKKHFDFAPHTPEKEKYKYI